MDKTLGQIFVRKIFSMYEKSYLSNYFVLKIAPLKTARILQLSNQVVMK